MNDQSFDTGTAKPLGKFAHPDITAKGETRASVPLIGATTLWFNTGTLCNIECLNCYIESSPTNDALVYITTAEVVNYLDQIKTRNWPTTEIGFTGGEPFMNPDMIDMTRACLERGYDVLILTNAMLPMMRKSVKAGLLALQAAFGDKLTLRVSLDHFKPEYHDKERGRGSYNVTIKGMQWLRDNDFKMAVAGRTVWGDSDTQSRAGYQALFAEHGFNIDAHNPAMTILFPEMDETVDVPEITTACWDILGKSRTDVMCSSSRMVVKRKGAPTDLAVAGLYAFGLQHRNSNWARQFERGGSKRLKLNHPHCAKFCVLGGASCSG